MKNVKNRFLRVAIIMLSLSVIEFSLYFNQDRCLTMKNAGFWLIFVAGICLGVSIALFTIWIKKEKVE